ncbi:MAG: AmmeMemoRadiSam system radical SAM enzyme [candidate division Zixibacteria bacterium]|nr:AmmeMemoRadiSam system radical SAM enzyme [candidate division Zixibacteria bacterium]
MEKEALYYEKLGNKKVQCHLCPWECKLTEGKFGVCRGKRNVEGRLYAVNYAKAVSVAMDPIEKKPLYHFHPGSQILSSGPNSCNLRCDHCQNWNISQTVSPTELVTPENLVSLALKHNSVGIAYTYTEPLMWFEYVLETAKLARSKKLVNVLVTNGYINTEPLLELLPLIDALNIDVKSMSQDFYKKVCKGKLEVVLKTVELLIEHKRHVELTYLIIPGLNDSDEELLKFVTWVADLNQLIPVHFSRYFPAYKADLPPTPVETMKKAYQIARTNLKYVYTGNINIPGTSDTYCPECKKVLISRSGYSIDVSGIEDMKCRNCKTPVDIIMTDDG